MSQGFLYRSKTKEQVIKEYLRTSKKIRHGCNSIHEALDLQRRTLRRKYEFKRYPKASRDSLLNPDLEPLSIKEITDKDSDMVLEGFNGIWSLIVSKNHDRGGLDFTIAVYNGVVYRFHPDIIEYQIIHDHGKEIYDQWRTMVKSQVNLLTDLVRQIQSQLDSLIPSFTCSDRSANLCRKAGIPVHQGVAFLVPAKYA